MKQDFEESKVFLSLFDFSSQKLLLVEKSVSL